MASQLSVKKDQPDNHQDDESSCCGSAANTRCSSHEDFEEASSRAVDEARGRLRNLRRTCRSRHASVSAKRVKARVSAKRTNSMGPSPRESKHFEEFNAAQQFEC